MVTVGSFFLVHSISYFLLSHASLLLNLFCSVLTYFTCISMYMLSKQHHKTSTLLIYLRRVLSDHCPFQVETIYCFLSHGFFTSFLSDSLKVLSSVFAADYCILYSVQGCKNLFFITRSILRLSPVFMPHSIQFILVYYKI